jgi:hypothetical protein
MRLVILRRTYLIEKRSVSDAAEDGNILGVPVDGQDVELTVLVEVRYHRGVRSIPDSNPGPLDFEPCEFERNIALVRNAVTVTVKARALINVRGVLDSV